MRTVQKGLRTRAGAVARGPTNSAWRRGTAIAVTVMCVADLNPWLIFVLTLQRFAVLPTRDTRRRFHSPLMRPQACAL